MTNKEFHKNSEEDQTLLNNKAAEFTNGNLTCTGKQLYNMFKTNRKAYTDHVNLLSKSGSEAAPKPKKPPTPLQLKIIDIYTKHAAASGIVPVTRPRETLKSKVSILCLILNI